jgi:peptidoglycan/LPS O-acetylase OafA/YrhL
MPQLRLLGPGMLRFILAAMVVVSHLTSLNIGRPAVLLFFMLSGYWVSRLLAGWQASVPAFYASRTLRVWPLYAVVTVLAWLLHAHAEAVRPESLWSALTLLGLAARAGDVIGVSWSLDIELQFYLAIPLITLAAQRLQPLALLALAWASRCLPRMCPPCSSICRPSLPALSSIACVGSPALARCAPACWLRRPSPQP